MDGEFVWDWPPSPGDPVVKFRWSGTRFPPRPLTETRVFFLLQLLQFSLE